VVHSLNLSLVLSTYSFSCTVRFMIEVEMDLWCLTPLSHWINWPGKKCLDTCISNSGTEPDCNKARRRSINIRWHSQNVSSDSRKWLIKHLFSPSSCKKQINKQNSYLLLAFLQSSSVITVYILTWQKMFGLVHI
jgi:hypothetical protein